MSVNPIILGTVIVTALVFLAARDLAQTSEDDIARRLKKALNIPIIIVLGVFVFLLGIGVLEIIRTATS